MWCERGELNPQGLAAHWILSPARLPVSPLSREVRPDRRPSILRTQGRRKAGAGRGRERGGSGGRRCSGRELGGFGRAGSDRHANRRGRGTLAEIAFVLGTEASETLLADTVGEPDTPAAPRLDAVDQRISPVALMPRATANQQGCVSLGPPEVARRVPRRAAEGAKTYNFPAPSTDSTFVRSGKKSSLGAETRAAGHNEL